MHCEHCLYDDDAVDGKCPASCTTVVKLATVCRAHEDCGGGQFCRHGDDIDPATKMNKHVCDACSNCQHNLDSATGICPKSCENLPEPCKSEGDCPKETFCRKDACLPCPKCEDSQGECAGNCLAMRTRGHAEVGSCSDHAGCPAGQFCEDGGECAECDACHTDKDAIDGACPAECAGGACTEHSQCDSTKFCAYTGKCMACDGCEEDHDAIDKACPAQCRGGRVRDGKEL
jgi:hypothetical protein